ncbi:heterokaryon incompatibility protein-domain-containing protein [Apodospora peruviana]|uniref:Heterokaryon incompatibility protein-domain-containing protein n=1 Tax=Apodospora peruviana TaxID=516989 RepID=A0AAE0IH68_9PEZI|nr:heterokaryon incompatibility protein-domain-containing protein [Apodospora peruviana]
MPRPANIKSLFSTYLFMLLGLSAVNFFASLSFDHCTSQYDNVRVKLSLVALLNLSLVGSSSHPLTCIALAAPAWYTLRHHLSARGGIYLSAAISWAVVPISDAFSLLKWQRRKRCDRKMNLDYPAMALMQLLFWQFARRTENGWDIMTRLFDRGSTRTWIASSLLPAFGLGVLVWDGGLTSVVKTYFPARFFLAVLRNVFEWPNYLASTTRIALGRRLKRTAAFWFIARGGAKPPYKYSPLPNQVSNQDASDIRLLRLHPRKKAPWIVKASLFSTSITQAPPFEAVSHRWTFGDEIPILLNGRSFSVPGSLHDMLCALRNSREERTLWIDSICINQVDMDEKTVQVRLMDRIYQSADRVIGWLGHGTLLPTAPSLRILREFEREFNALPPEGLGTKWGESITTGDMHRKLRSLASLFCNEFFFRKWIIQEERAVAGAENVMIMELFRKWRQDNNLQQGGVPLADLLLQSADFECSNPRDCVYGLLGLSTTSARENIDPLYHVDIGEGHVSMVATRFCLQHETSFGLLELSGIGYPHLEDEQTRPVERPSWVPRWNLFHVTKTKMLVLRSEKYQTATHLPCIVSPDDTTYPGLLEIKGSFIDVVDTGSEIWHPWKIIVNNAGFSNEKQEITVLSKLLDLVEWMFAEARRFDTEYNYTAKRQNPIWRTLFHDSSVMGDEHATHFEESFTKLDETVRTLRPLLAPDYERDDLDKLTISHEFILSLIMTIYPVLGRRLCNTRQGRIGIIPPYSQKGDQVCVFAGARNPFLLRPSVDTYLDDDCQRTAYELVGVCYIDGIMQGELKGKSLEMEMICLV